jgi:hypothetical protein
MFETLPCIICKLPQNTNSLQVVKFRAHPGSSTFNLVFKYSPSAILNALRHQSERNLEWPCVVFHQRIILTSTSRGSMCSKDRKWTNPASIRELVYCDNEMIIYSQSGPSESDKSWGNLCFLLSLLYCDSVSSDYITSKMMPILWSPYGISARNLC